MTVGDQEALEIGLMAYLRTCPAGIIAGGRVVNDFAKTGTTYPYILLNLQAERGPKQQDHRTADYRYLIKGVAKDTDGSDGLETATRIASELYTALEDQQASIPLGDDWEIYACERIGVVSYTEQTDRGQFVHRGGIYRIRVNEE